VGSRVMVRCVCTYIYIYIYIYAHIYIYVYICIYEVRAAVFRYKFKQVETRDTAK